MDKQYKTVPLTEIHPYPNNPRINDAAAQDVAKSIEQCGYIAPIVVDEDMVILAGHTRKLALESLGKTEADIIIVSGLSDAQKRKYRLLDNKTQESADWDFDLLEQELDGLDFGDLELDWGIDLDDEPTEAVEDDYDAEPPEEPRAKMGDIYQLGRHRLMCGDSTDKKSVKKLFDGSEPFCMLTDPPYCSGGFQEVGKRSGSIGTRDNIMIANDTLSTRGYQALIKSVLQASGNIGIAYIFTDWRMWVNLFDAVESSGFGVRNMVIWDKGTPGMGIGWRSQHEVIMLASRSAIKFNPHKAQGNVIQCGRTGNVNHPTEKPIELIGKVLEVTDFADKVYDPFGGSGTTLIACEQLERTCYMMEYEPRYIDVIIDRYEKFTNQKAVKIGS